MVPVFFSVCFFLLASSSFAALEPYSVLLRVLGAALLIIPVLWRKHLSERASPRKFFKAFLMIGIGFAIYLTTSTLLHGNLQAFVFGFISFVLVSVLTHTLLYYYPPAQILGGAYAALLLVCVVSVVAYRWWPSVAIEESRLRGVIENANGLGFAAFALGSVSLLGRPGRWQFVIGLGISIVVLFLTGSRASALVLALLIIGCALGGLKRAKILTTLALLIGSVTWLVAPNVFAETLLFRTTDSRATVLETMRQTMATSFWTGVGELPSETMIAGSPFAAGITGGTWGLIGLGLMYLGLLVGFVSSRPRALIFVLAGVVHSGFENWMLSFSAPMLLIFFVVLIGFVKTDSIGRRTSTRTSAHAPPDILHPAGTSSGNLARPRTHS